MYSPEGVPAEVQKSRERLERVMKLKNNPADIVDPLRAVFKEIEEGSADMRIHEYHHKLGQIRTEVAELTEAYEKTILEPARMASREAPQEGYENLQSLLADIEAAMDANPVQANDYRIEQN